MFCPKCGTKNDDGASFCSNCGNSLTQQMGNPMPSPTPPGGGYGLAAIPNYMVQAILVTIFCCLPFGIVAIVKASQVSRQQSLGDYTGALRASAEAKNWCWISFGIGVVCNVMGWLYFLVVLGASLSSAGAFN